MQQTMTAAVLTGHGGLDMLEVRDDVPVPEPGPGQVLVRVAAAGVNNTDVWTRQGAYGTADDPDAVAGWRGVPIDVPRIQGADVSGRIVAVGPGVDDQRTGTRVLVDPATYDDPAAEDPEIVAVLGSESDGGFAEYVRVADAQAHDVTASPLTDTQLAALPIAYGTAMGMLDRAEVRDGEVVLVTGASGGVGLALVQLASARDATVIAVTSTGKAEAVRAAGAHHTVLRDDDSSTLADRVRDTAGGEVDVIADVVGDGLFETLFPLLVTSGRLVTCGAIAGPVVKVDLRRLYLRRRRLIGSTMHTPAQFARLVDEARAGRIDPVVAGTYPLADIRQAQRAFEADGHVGKLVVRPPAARTDRTR